MIQINTAIDKDGKVICSIDNLLAYLSSKKDEAYWSNGVQTLTDIIKALEMARTKAITLVPPTTPDTVVAAVA